GRQRDQLPAVQGLRLPDQAVPSGTAPRDRLPLPREQGAFADDRGRAEEVVGRGDPRPPQGAGADFGEHERPHGGLTRLPEPNRVGKELGVDRNAVPHLSGAGHEDERTVPRGPTELTRRGSEATQPARQKAGRFSFVLSPGGASAGSPGRANEVSAT